MIRKLFFIVLTLFTVTVTVNADPTEVPLTVRTQPNHGSNPRSPIDVPVFYLDGHTLIASSYTVGCTVQLFDENDNVVFSTYIFIEGDILLPTTLSGTYAIEVTHDNQTFEGEIELE